MNIMFLTNELNYTNGVSTHLYYLLKSLNHLKDINIVLMCSGGDAINKFKAEGINVKVDINLNHKNRSLKNFGTAIYSIYKLIKSEKIQIVHSHNHYAANIAHRVSKFIKFKTIQTNHGILDEGGKLNHFSAEHFVVLNNTIFKYFLNNKISDRNRLSLIHNGIDFPEEQVSKNGNIKKIIAASRLVREKGLTTFIKAVSILDEDIRNETEFIIAGEGEAENELKILNEKLNTGIKFIGKQINLNEILKDTDIFVIPSESENEAFPMTILEAAAANNLIISSDFKGSEDIMTNDADGFIFKKKDEKDLSSKMKHAILNPDNSRKISQSFFIKAKKLYNSNLMSEKHYELYKSILTESIK